MSNTKIGYVKSHQLQAVFARRREQEHMRVERSAEVNRYYDHWGKVTTRFGNWVAPEYYKNAEDQLNHRRELKEKEAQQKERRERLRELLNNEMDRYQEELRERDRNRSRKLAGVSTESLRKIDQNLKEREQIKRKLELEAKLYGRWRHGVDDENLIFESKSSNETLAKLNWLDKKVEEQLEREKEEAIAQERNLRLQEEIRKTEQAQRERQLIREQEIKEIRALQEKHMDELKARQSEADALKDDEKRYRTCLNEVERELELLDESSAAALEPTELSHAYNLKKIKVFIRKRSEMFRNQIKLCVSMLERLLTYSLQPERVQKLLEQNRERLELETLKLSQVEAMYESEAKFSLQRCEAAWQSECVERYHELKQLLNDEQCAYSKRLNDNLQRQTDTYEVRSAHLSAIESSSEKMKQLMSEEDESPRSVKALVDGQSSPRLAAGSAEFTSAIAGSAQSMRAAEGSAGSMSGTAGDSYSNIRSALGSNVTPNVPSKTNTASSSSLPKVTNSFSNLNLDVWESLTSARGGIDSPRMQRQRDLRVVTPATAERPKFARKRVAWT